MAAVKALSRERRVGHAGTLDLLATGVLPVCLGKATRVVGFLMGAVKVYRADIELGVSTDSYDALGNVTRTADIASVGLADIVSALAPFHGRIRQTPPMFSALKHRGTPLYRLARAGIEIERAEREAVIHRLDILAWQPPVLSLEIACGKGTYIRSIAHDLGESLGCGASLKGLVRRACGGFRQEESVSLPRLEEAFRAGYWTRYLYPPDEALLGFDAVVLGDAKAGILGHGGALPARASYSDDRLCRAYDLEGRFLGVLRPEGGQWRACRVFTAPSGVRATS